MVTRSEMTCEDHVLLEGGATVVLNHKDIDEQSQVAQCNSSSTTGANINVLDRLFAKRWCQIISIVSMVLLAICITLILTMLLTLFRDTQDVSNMKFTTSVKSNLSHIRQSHNDSNATGNTAFPSAVVQNTAQPLPYASCDGGRSAEIVQGVYGNFCDERTDEGRCRMVEGTMGTTEIVFIPRRAVQRLQVGLCGRPLLGNMALLCVSDVAKVKEGCSGFNLPCPLEANQVYTYRATDRTRALPGVPQMRVNTEISLIDENGDDIFCITLPVVLEPRP